MAVIYRTDDRFVVRNCRAISGVLQHEAAVMTFTDMARAREHIGDDAHLLDAGHDDREPPHIVEIYVCG
jgi:hypothetical protein